MAVCMVLETPIYAIATEVDTLSGMDISEDATGTDLEYNDEAQSDTESDIVSYTVSNPSVSTYSRPTTYATTYQIDDGSAGGTTAPQPVAMYYDSSVLGITDEKKKKDMA